MDGIHPSTVTTLTFACLQRKINTTIGTSFRSNSSNLTELNNEKLCVTVHTRLHNGIVSRRPFVERLSGACRRRQRRRRRRRHKRLRRCATDRERDRALKNRSKSCDRTRLRPLSESAMTFAPFMAWNKSLSLR